MCKGGELVGNKFFPELSEEEKEDIRKQSAANAAEQIKWAPCHRVLQQVFAERKAQDNRYGGPQHDNKHNSHDWIAYITKHLGKTVMWPFDKKLFRKQMIRVAALAVAATEWVDRDKEY